MAKEELYNDAIHDLIKVITERKEGFEKASQYVDDDELSELFESYVKQSEDFALELAPFNDKFENDLLGTQNFSEARKLWMDRKAALSSGDRKEILDSCISAEEVALNKYNEIIQDHNLPEELYNVIDQQREKIEEAYENIKIQINSA